MNELERLKSAMEAEPMAVLPWHFPESCDSCFCGYEEPNKNWRCSYMERDCEAFCEVPDWCPWNKAIAYVEPDGHVKYLREEEE